MAGRCWRLSGEPSVSAAWKPKVCADLFFIQSASLTAGSHPPSLAYQRFEGKGERQQLQEVERDCQRHVRRPEQQHRSRQVPCTVGGTVNGSSLTSI